MIKLKQTVITTFLIATVAGQAYAQDIAKEATQAVAGDAVEIAIPEAVAGCELPTAPIIPDGNVASQDELLAAQRAMKDFQGLLVGYRGCLDEGVATLDLETEEGLAAQAASHGLHDRSVDTEEAIAEQFNLAVRAFKAKAN